MLLNYGAGEDSEYSLEGLMLKLKLQYFGHLMRRDDSLEKTLMLGKIEGRRRRGWQDEMVGWHHHLNGHEFEQILGDSEGQGSLACCSPWGHKELDIATEQQHIVLRFHICTLIYDMFLFLTNFTLLTISKYIHVLQTTQFHSKEV